MNEKSNKSFAEKVGEEERKNCEGMTEIEMGESIDPRHLSEDVEAFLNTYLTIRKKINKNKGKGIVMANHLLGVVLQQFRCDGGKRAECGGSNRGGIYV